MMTQRPYVSSVPAIVCITAAAVLIGTPAVYWGIGAWFNFVFDIPPSIHSAGKIVGGLAAVAWFSFSVVMVPAVLRGRP